MNRCSFDKEAFCKVLKLKALRVPLRQCSVVRERLASFVLSLRRVRPIQHDSTSNTRLILLAESLPDPLPPPVQELVKQEGYQLVDYDLEVGYSRLTALEVMTGLLPEEVTIPTSFETVGHIAHLNLRPEHEEYKYLIGEVLLDKNPSISTVINKKGTIENEFRVLEYELLAGDGNLETEVKREGLRFYLDFGKVYWNSRLEHEHKRLVQRFHPTEVVLDLMAGIGPFAIPAAKKGCLVFANDKNPSSYEYLLKNIECNKVTRKVIPLNLDARYCLRMILGLEEPVARYVPGRVVLPEGSLRFDHVVMNYPQYAVEFLDMFKGVFDRGVWMEEQLPFIHCYTFMTDEEDESDLQRKCEQVMGAETSIEMEIHVVRNVAPSKVMCCISFRLPGMIAFPTQSSDSLQGYEDDTITSKTIKKQKCNEDNDS